MIDVPDVYADSVRVHTTAFGTALIFAKVHPDALMGQPIAPVDQVIVRMSLEHMKVMAMALRKQLLAHEQQSRTEIALPFDTLNAAGLSKEDW